MTTLRTAAQQALEALDKSLYMNDYCGLEVSKHDQPDVTDAIENLRAALAEPTVKESLQVESAFAENATTQQQLEEAPPSDYRRGYWDGFDIGKREGRIEAENALAEPQEPDSPERRCGGPGCDMKCCQPVQEPIGYLWPTGRHPEFRFTQQKRDGIDGTPVYTSPPQRKPVEWDGRCMLGHCNSPAGCENSGECRAVERAHKIGGEA